MHPWFVLLLTDALAGFVALGAPLLWAGGIGWGWAATRTELMALSAPWSAPIPDPRWAPLVPLLIALRGPEPLSERAEGSTGSRRPSQMHFGRIRAVSGNLALPMDWLSKGSYPLAGAIWLDRP